MRGQRRGAPERTARGAAARVPWRCHACHPDRGPALHAFSGVPGILPLCRQQHAQVSLRTELASHCNALQQRLCHPSHCSGFCCCSRAHSSYAVDGRLGNKTGCAVLIIGLVTCREEESKDAGDICSPHIPAAAVAHCMPAFHYGHVMAPGTPRAGPAQRGPKRGIKSIAAPAAAVVQVPPVQVRRPGG